MVKTTAAIDVLQPPINSIPEDLIRRYDPEYVKLFNKYNVGRLATHQVLIEDYRADPSKYIISYGRQDVDSSTLRITERKCPVKDGEITIRICEPLDGASSSIDDQKSKRPAYMNFHGGGWVFGNLETGHNFCKRVAIELDCVTFDVDYRLAPERPYPAAVDDSWAAFNWVSPAPLPYHFPY
jgi:acetyl esterase/lipase